MRSFDFRFQNAYERHFDITILHGPFLHKNHFRLFLSLFFSSQYHSFFSVANAFALVSLFPFCTSRCLLPRLPRYPRDSFALRESRLPPRASLSFSLPGLPRRHHPPLPRPGLPHPPASSVRDTSSGMSKGDEMRRLVGFHGDQPACTGMSRLNRRRLSRLALARLANRRGTTRR